jgi:hypothetical protein
MKPSTRIGSGKRVLSRSLVYVTLLVATGITGVAHADVAADSERANLLFKKGKIAFNAGKYNDALRIYGEAWSLKKSPDIAANLAQAESELGKHRDAAEHFAFALAHILPSSTDEQKFALADGLDAEKKEIGTLRVTIEPADSTLTIDDLPVTVPAAGDVYIEPGEHHALVTHDGYEPHQEALNVSKGAAQVLWIKLDQVGAVKAAATPPEHPIASTDAGPPPIDDKGGRSILPVIVGGGLVVAGAAVGVAFLLSGNSSQKDADALFAKSPEPNACGTGTPHEADCAALHSKNVDIDSARTIEVIGFSVAGAAAIGTAVYLLWPHTDAATANHWAPSFAIAPGAVSVGLSGHF